MATHTEDELRNAARVIADSVDAVSVNGEWSIDLPDPAPGALQVIRRPERAAAGVKPGA